MPRTNKKEQPKCNPSTSAFLYMYKKGKNRTFTESRTEYDGREGNDSSTKLPKTKKASF